MPESDGVRYNTCEAGSSRLVLRKPKHDLLSCEPRYQQDLDTGRVTRRSLAGAGEELN